MAFKQINLNPHGKLVGDCVVRAVSMALDQPWDKTYIALSLEGFFLKDVFTSNSIWGAYLMDNGFERYAIPNSCPECYSIREFAEDHPQGTFVVGTGTHAVAIIDGNYIDSYDSGDKVPIVCYYRP